MEKKYQNPNLIKYFEKHVAKMNVEDTFKPLLVDILLRRAYEFSLTPQEIQQDMNSLLGSLDTIKIGKMPKKYTKALGLYQPKIKQITLNKDYVYDCLKWGQSGLENLYVTLTHEVYHALSKDEFGKDRLGSRNRYNGKYNSTLLETIVETAADRTVFSRTENDKYFFRKETNGYPEMTFVVPVIAATYGVSEREFLKHAIMGRDNLINFLASTAKETSNEVAGFLDGIELNLAKMHKALYSKRKNPIPEDKARDLISESIFAISYICNSKLEDRYAKKPITDGFSVYNFVENAKYNHIKLHTILDIEMENLRRMYGINVVPIITEMKEESDYDERKTIIDMDRVVSRRQNFDSEVEYLRVFNYAKRGMLDNLNPLYLNQKGIAYTRNSTYFSPMDSRVVRKFDDDDFPTMRPWNNYAIVDYISKYIPELVPRRNIVEYAKDKLEEFMYRDRKQLPEQASISKAEVSNHFELSETDLKKFNDSTNKVLSEHKNQTIRTNSVEKNKEE